MLIVNTTRQQIITCLPNHNNVCEIGVDVGNYSLDILNNCNPNKLHLIDPWVHIDDPSYKNDTVNVNSRQEEKYRNVLKRFSNEILSGQVKVHRGFSYDVLQKFPNKYFDWIYVDGMHTYDTVLKDLNLCYSKVKDDGFILGHDYANHEIAKYMNFGVIEAITDFTLYNPTCKLFAITLESGWPSYILYKNNGPHVDHVIYNFITKTSNPIDISDDLWKDINFFQKWFMIDGNKYVTCLYKR
jgi:hypothetical protein